MQVIAAYFNYIAHERGVVHIKKQVLCAQTQQLMQVIYILEISVFFTVTYT